MIPRSDARGIGVLLLVALVPCLLCSGMATVVAGTAYGAWVFGIIVLLYLVIASVGIVTWLAVGRRRSASGSQAEDREPEDNREQDGR